MDNRFKFRSFAQMSVLVLQGLFLLAAANDWFPHAAEIAAIAGVISVIAVCLFQIKKRGWKIIGRALRYFFVSLRLPLRVGKENRAGLRDFYRWVDDPLLVELTDVRQLDKNGNHVFQLKVSYADYEDRNYPTLFVTEIIPVLGNRAAELIFEAGYRLAHEHELNPPRIPIPRIVREKTETFILFAVPPALLQNQRWIEAELRFDGESRFSWRRAGRILILPPVLK